MAMGGTAGTLASSVCYPLDTIRRRMQMVGCVYNGQLDAFATIWREVLRSLLVSGQSCAIKTMTSFDPPTAAAQVENDMTSSTCRRASAASTEAGLSTR